MFKLAEIDEITCLLPKSHSSLATVYLQFAGYAPDS